MTDKSELLRLHDEIVGCRPGARRAELERAFREALHAALPEPSADDRAEAERIVDEWAGRTWFGESDLAPEHFDDLVERIEELTARARASGMEQAAKLDGDVALAVAALNTIASRDYVPPHEQLVLSEAAKMLACIEASTLERAARIAESMSAVWNGVVSKLHGQDIASAIRAEIGEKKDG